MVNIRRAKAEDIWKLQACNLMNLPENYQMKYYYYHILSWPDLLYLAETDDKKVVGYVLAKLQVQLMIREDENEREKNPHGHITSISVLATYRKMGIATKLMQATLKPMKELYGCRYCSLHVRVSNRSALGLYKDVLNYEVLKVEPGYYADGEDAYEMRKDLWSEEEIEKHRLKEEKKKEEEDESKSKEMTKKEEVKKEKKEEKEEEKKEGQIKEISQEKKEDEEGKKKKKNKKKKKKKKEGENKATEKDSGDEKQND